MDHSPHQQNNWTHNRGPLLDSQHFLWRLKRAKLPPHILTLFYRETIESVLTSCLTMLYGNYSLRIQNPTLDCEDQMMWISLSSTVHSPRLLKDSSHHPHVLFMLLSAKRFKIICSTTTTFFIATSQDMDYSNNFPRFSCTALYNAALGTQLFTFANCIAAIFNAAPLFNSLPSNSHYYLYYPFNTVLLSCISTVLCAHCSVLFIDLHQSCLVLWYCFVLHYAPGEIIFCSNISRLYREMTIKLLSRIMIIL